jgi:hypothetical protein
MQTFSKPLKSTDEQLNDMEKGKRVQCSCSLYWKYTDVIWKLLLYCNRNGNTDIPSVYRYGIIQNAVIQNIYEDQFYGMNSNL